MFRVSRSSPHIPVKVTLSEICSGLLYPKRIAPGSVDLVCLSEMVFTGGYSSL